MVGPNRAAAASRVVNDRVMAVRSRKSPLRSPAPASGPPDRAEGPGQGTPQALVNSPIYYLVAIANQLSNSASKRYQAAFGIGVTEFRIIRMLTLESDILPGRMCEVTGMDKSVVSRALSALESKGLAVRRDHPRDPRRSRWSLTDRGEAIAAMASDANAMRQERLWTGFTDLERIATMSVLRRLFANVPLVIAADISSEAGEEA